MAVKTKNMPASVHQRLLNKARELSCPFDEILHILLSKDLYIGFLKADTLTGLSLKEP